MTDDAHRLMLDMMPKCAHESHGQAYDCGNGQCVVVQESVHWLSSWADGQYSRSGHALQRGVRA